MESIEYQKPIQGMQDVKGIIFDYGGTLDSRGVHWSEVIWDGYRHAGMEGHITKEQFREAYVFAERELARVRHIMPNDDFLALMRKKIVVEAHAVRQMGIAMTNEQCDTIATYCDRSARECIEEARPVLETLHNRFPMMLVSNFYGNIDSVLRAYDIRRYFKGIIESSVVGIRKPNPTLFRLGVDALELESEQILVVGDSLRKDIEPAESLGCHVLWLKGKGWTTEEDAQTHPHTITSICQVLEFI